MRTLRTLVLMTVGCVLLAGCAGALRDVPRPSVVVEAVKLQGLTLQSVTLRWELRVENPYSVALPLDRIRYTVKTRNDTFLQGSLATEVSVPAHGTKRVPVSVNVPFDRLMSEVRAVESGTVVPYTGTLKLNVETPLTGSLTLTGRTDGEFPVPAPPILRLRHLTWDELSLQRARADLAFDVRNPNEFALSVQTFSYELHLAGRPVTNVRLTDAFDVEAGGSRPLRMTFSFSPLRFSSALMETLESNRASYRLEGDLSVETRFGALTIPLRREGSLRFQPPS